MFECLHYDKIDISEGTDVNKTSESKDEIFATIGIFYIKASSFNQMSAINQSINQSKFQSNVCDKCHDLLMMSMNLSDIDI